MRLALQFVGREQSEVTAGRQRGAGRGAGEAGGAKECSRTDHGRCCILPFGGCLDARQWFQRTCRRLSWPPCWPLGVKTPRIAVIIIAVSHANNVLMWCKHLANGLDQLHSSSQLPPQTQQYGTVMTLTCREARFPQLHPKCDVTKSQCASSPCHFPTSCSTATR